MGVGRWGSTTVFFFLCMCYINFCEKRCFLFFFFLSERLSQKIKQVMTGKLMKNTTLIYRVFEFMPTTLAWALGSEEAKHRSHQGVHSSWPLQNWVTRCLGTHGAAAIMLSPQSPREVGAAVWLVGGDGGFQDLLWERQGRELQPLPSILFNLIPRANPKWVPTEPCHLGFHNASLAICHGKQPSEL